MMLLIKERVDELVTFFNPYFPNNCSKKFIEDFENIDEKKINAWRALNQTERLISLGESIYNLKRRDSLRLLFLIICAECITKLCKDFSGEGHSKKYVKIFFSDFCDRDDKCLIQNSIYVDRKLNGITKKQGLRFSEAIGLLYKVRCDVVHEGLYWDFTFKMPNTNFTIAMNTDGQIYYPNISYKELRDIVVKGAINAIRNYLQKN